MRAASKPTASSPMSQLIGWMGGVPRGTARETAPRGIKIIASHGTRGNPHQTTANRRSVDSRMPCWRDGSSIPNPRDLRRCTDKIGVQFFNRCDGRGKIQPACANRSLANRGSHRPNLLRRKMLVEQLGIGRNNFATTGTAKLASITSHALGKTFATDAAQSSLRCEVHQRLRAAGFHQQQVAEASTKHCNRNARHDSSGDGENTDPAGENGVKLREREWG